MLLVMQMVVLVECLEVWVACQEVQEECQTWVVPRAKEALVDPLLRKLTKPSLIDNA